MCDECLTREIRVLVPPFEVAPDHSWYYTLRVGQALGPSGVLIVGPQETVARFEFITDPDSGEVFPRLTVTDPVEWVHFLPAYARELGKSEEDWQDIVDELEAEALTLYPRIAELTPEW